MHNIKPKKCRDCGEVFEPFKPMQPRCVPCALKKARKDEERRVKKAQDTARKAEKKKHRERKERLKTRSQWVREAQAAFNRYIRLRDSAEPCISCGKPASQDASLTGSGWDCGHYRSVGSAPELRFEELNTAKQCVKCNQHLSGNVVEYRKGLLKKIGPDAVEWLEGPHEPKKYTIDDLKEIKKKYAKLARELERRIEDDN